ncbi:DUF2795 domain-containing protein [Streptomyces sp. NPDC051219]|uniref:DUF2795 domain-containing protein n=1 Tax=Streptomyces sp. NPDC051219 TaxID=3155283 RepID=UPI00341DE46A
MQRGSARLSRRQDDEMKHQLQGLLRSGHPTRTEEWNDPEPLAEDDPEVASGPVPRPGSTSETDGLRFELARHLARTPFPAHRRELLRTLDQRHAPDRLLDLVAQLPPDRTYRTVEDMVRALPEE